MLVCADPAMTGGSTMLGRFVAAAAGSTWKAKGCAASWNPVSTVAVYAPGAAFGATTTSAQRRFGLSTQTLRTTMSLEPTPNVVCPSTNCVFTPVISIIDDTPAGSAFVEELNCKPGEAAGPYGN